MEGETMEKGNMEGGGGSSSAQGFPKVSPNFHHQSQSHQRNLSMDNNGHHHLHQHHVKTLLPAHHNQQYHQKAPSPYGRNEGSGGGEDYPPYPPPGNAIQNLPNHYHPHYASHSRSITPGVRSVVTHSFSMEEEQREDGSSRYSGGHPRNQNQRDPGNYLRDEYRSPPAEYHPDQSSEQHRQREQHDRPFELQTPLVPHQYNTRRDYQFVNGRELPPVPEGTESLLPLRGLIRRPDEQNRPERVQQNPHEEVQASAIERSLSSVSAAGGPLKRSFWHHSRPVQASNANGEYGNEGSMSTSASLPQEFMPPKRSKTCASESGRSSKSPRREKEYIVTVRSQAASNSQQLQKQQQQQLPEITRGNSDIGSLGPNRSSPPGAGLSPTGGWYNSRSRSMSWEAREDYYRRDPRSAPSWSSRSPNGRDGPAPMSSGSGPHWMGAPYMPSPRPGISNDGNHYDAPPQSWEASPRDWGHHHHHQQQQQYSPHLPYLAWSAGNNGKGGDHRERDQNGEKKILRQAQDRGVFSSSEHHHPGMHFMDGSAQPQPHRMGPMIGSPIRTSSGVEPSLMMKGQPRGIIENGGRGLKKNEPVKLLALPEDRISLSETLCIVRENIEVFTATVEDVEAPAPGRKHAVTVGQVGLRCIHCRHTTRSSERVKRAVCYPSSIKRIYRTVIDMKLDHFLHCKFVPQNLKDTLQALKANNTRSTGTTMQYFIRAATTLGMVDGPSGVRLADSNIAASPVSLTSPSLSLPNGKSKLLTSPASSKTKGRSSSKAGVDVQNSGKKSESSSSSDFRINRTSSMSSEGTTTHASVTASDSDIPSELFTGKVALSVPEDKMSLSPLRCFLREQVCAFSATEEDIAVRTPTTFAVSVGQVGIGCIHCLGQPAKLRLNRAVCFPFSIARIYQSVADIQRFHLGECKMVPKETREKFLKLQSQSSKGSKGLATRQYWVTSAKKIGLVDTSKGIRFCRDPSVPAKKAVSLDILAQVASNVTTVNRPLVLPEDKPYIAEFLYLVMSQLQPCRFTEADRNKRRLKDVGCIGVECKHCAGQVDGRKFFWSSVNAVESNFVSVHTHMMECRMVPKEIKEKLGELKKLRKEQTAALKTGSQKAFFARVWKRLHEEPKKGKDSPMPTEKTKVKVKNEMDPAVKATFSVSLSHDTLDSPIQMTPTTSPASIEKPFTEITMGKISPGSPDSNQKIEAVSDKMAMAGI